jgi:hypothetical protein
VRMLRLWISFVVSQHALRNVAQWSSKDIVTERDFVPW